MSQASPTAQVEALKAQLLEAYVQRQAHEDGLKSVNEKITAIRNVLAGVTLGVELGKAIAAKEPEKPAVDAE